MLLTLGCLAGAFYFATQARWAAKLQHHSSDFTIRLPRAPLWDPPPLSTYADFHKTVSASPSPPRSFPPETECTTVYVLEREMMLLDVLLWLWVTTAVVSLFYPGDRRDRVIRTAAFSFLGITGGVGASVVLWMIYGGWGPPMPHCFGYFGLAAALTYALATMARVPRRANWRGGRR